LKSLKDGGCGFTRSTLREIKNPRKHKLSALRSSPKGENENEPFNDEEIKEENLQKFVIDTSQNVMILIGDDERDAKTIVESFL